MAEVIDIKDFKSKNIIFDKPQEKKKGSSFYVYLKYKYPSGKVDFLRIRTEKMKTPFGVSSMDGQNIADYPSLTTNESIALAFDSFDNEAIKEINALDILGQEICRKHAVEFMIADPDDDIPIDNQVKAFVKRNFISSIKYSIDKDTKKISDKYPPSFKVKLYKNDGYYNHKFYKKGNKQLIKVSPETISDLIPKNSEIMAIVTCPKLWVISGKVGFSWIPEQIQIHPSSSTVKECDFPSDDENDEDDASIHSKQSLLNKENNEEESEYEDEE